MQPGRCLVVGLAAHINIFLPLFGLPIALIYAGLLLVPRECLVFVMASMSHKPVLDEESFTRLLAAAYVMQEHTDRMRANMPVSDFTEIVAQIVDCQHVIQTRKLELDPALELIVSRLQKVAGAIGAAISVREGDTVLYHAGSGSAATLVGESLPLDASAAAQCIKEGRTVKVPFAEADPQLDHALMRRLGAQSLLIAPVYHEGKVAAAIELFFSEARLLEESAVRACELMAGLAAEAMAQSAEEELKQELAAERASVLMALETLKPQLQRLVKEPVREANAPSASKTEAEVCRACGHNFAGNETYCGVCGASRATGRYPGTELQSKWATLWERQLLTGETQDHTPVFKRKPPVSPVPLDVESEDEFPTLTSNGPEFLDAEIHVPEESTGQEEDRDDLSSNAYKIVADGALFEESSTEAIEPETTSLVRRWTTTLGWPQGSRTQELVDRIRAIWSDRRGDVSLALATVVVLVAFVWGFWPNQDRNLNPSNSAMIAQTPGNKRASRPKAPQLTLWEKTLVTLGLAQAPAAPEYKGNPQAHVWVDLNTALYYCEGSELYGKTPKGKFTTQGEAQQDQFEAARRAPCE